MPLLLRVHSKTWPKMLFFHRFPFISITAKKDIAPSALLSPNLNLHFILHSPLWLTQLQFNYIFHCSGEFVRPKSRSFNFIFYYIRIIIVLSYSPNKCDIVPELLLHFIPKWYYFILFPLYLLIHFICVYLFLFSPFDYVQGCVCFWFKNFIMFTFTIIRKTTTTMRIPRALVSFFYCMNKVPYRETTWPLSLLIIYYKYQWMSECVEVCRNICSILIIPLSPSPSPFSLSWLSHNLFYFNNRLVIHR